MTISPHEARNLFGLDISQITVIFGMKAQRLLFEIIARLFETSGEISLPSDLH